jgi:4-hydroxythreonine-4-phosphate dehydrogenase
MIYVTQGHERGIGLEVFLKSALLLDQASLSNLSLIASNQTLLQTLESLNLDFELGLNQLHFGGIDIKLIEIIPSKNKSESQLALDLGMKLCEENKGSILFTLPTSKDQLSGFAGHTEYFRHVYQNSSLPMFFYGPDYQIMLLSDHEPVAKLSPLLKENYIKEKILITVDSMKKWKLPLKRVLLSGFNPHAGENGLLGQEEEGLKKLLPKLRQKYTDLEFNGPIPADTMVFSHRDHNDLLVYWFHDQGLGVFKGHHGLIGANITLGMPFLRLSVDHGTAFDLFGKNQADERGCYYVLKLAHEFSKRIENRG